VLAAVCLESVHGKMESVYDNNVHIFIGSHAAIFMRPLLSVDVSVCLSATLMLNISETKRSMGSCLIGTPYEVRTVRRLVTSSMTSRDSMTL